MLDAGRIMAWVFAVLACARPRDLLGYLAAALVGALLAWEIGAPLATHAVGSGGAGPAFAMAFVGPSRLAPHTWMTALEGIVAAVAAASASRRGRGLRPEAEAARRWDRASLRFLFLAVLSGLLVVFDGLVYTLMRGP